ncbi:DHH family phosphoesterase [Flavobacterium croceum]|uniref:DHH family phosphoesterase n=1 Tax=Flavobacterium croceum TaxID=370975 RepID=UPI0024A7B0C0|nr:bifunctional oligoribonuclease/PAP phosphatase NrnA [Flavobacterium croceum]
MNTLQVQQLQELLANPKQIAIIPHRSPDGDAMGSTLALYLFLKKLNHTPVVISPNDFPEFLAWMPSSETVLIYENNKAEIAQLLARQDLIFTLDFNALHRTGELEQVLKNLTVPFIMIDHHELPETYATITYSDTRFGSTCEMVYNTLVALNKKELIDKDIATCLYTGIMTDSGQFRYPKTTGTTHRIVADLIDLGAPNTEIPNLIFDNNSFDRLHLLGRALQNMKVLPQYKTAYTSLSQQELQEFNYVKGDTEGIVNYGLTIKNISFAAIFIEQKQEGYIKISFRSQGSFDVNQFARTHFNGGGHINAAGGKSFDNMQVTLQKFEKIVSEIHI